ncbi:hypothetical protein [Pelagibius marinus]|uniref:hypothetical protein n=1 Tax=Pelagibius marinus TaxID=2762760 RepID=UPI001872FFE7|nr:hypothetical protein [Pelagibius marinus]
MSDIFATLAAGTTRPAATGSGETAVRVVDPSPELARLATGENLRGTVVGKDDHGHLLVRTRLGVLQLAATRALPVGTEVVLQVRSVGPQVMINLLLLDSAGAAASNAGAPGQTPPGVASPQAPLSHTLPPNPHDLVQPTQVLRGVLHAAPPVPLLAGLPTAQPGAELLVRILALGVQSQTAGTTPGTLAASRPSGTAANPAAVPATGPAPGLAAGQVAGQLPGQPPGQPGGQGGGPTAPAAPAGAPAAGSAGSEAGTPATGAPQSSPPGTAAPSPPGTGNAANAATAGLRLAPQTPVANSGHSVASALQNLSTEAAVRAAGAPSGPQGPSQGAQGAAAVPGGGDASGAGLRLTGLVTATTSSGQPILHTPLGTLTLDTRAALPPGSSLALQITLPAAQDTPAARALAAAWPSLETLEQTIFHGLQAAQVEAVARALPQVGPRLASGMLFFLSALNQGNLGGWLAPATVGAERAEHGDLFERLGREFAGLNRPIDTPAGEWRFVNLPLWSEQGLRELRCFFRHQDHGGGQDGKGGDKATRFVLELELERHGELQLDGLVRARRFDLLLRSRRPLPALVRGDLMALFAEANAIAGYTGQLVFQASPDWLQLLAAQSAAQPHDGLNV